MKNPSVIIIKKPRRDGHGGHHGGAWKVAYADFVTAMMAFFLVMWLVTQSNAVKAAVAGYFKDPGVFDYEKSTGIIQGGAMQLDPDTPAAVRPKGGQGTALDGRAILKEAARRLRDVLGGMPEFKQLERQVEIQLTPEGLRIELLEADEGTFFDSGSATLKSATERLLGTMAIELGKLENPVVIEGHTDSRPYSNSRNYTNWELSSDRANAARRAMEGLGLRARQVQGVRGYADTRLRVPGAPTDPRNRRVSIVVQNTDFAEPPAASVDDLARDHPARGGSAGAAPAQGGH